ncbi:MAG: PEP-CTERM sorting domain-containing protein [Burkholderiaceae bacterium]
MFVRRLSALRYLIAGAVLSVTSLAHADLITADLTDFTNGGGFFAQVELEDTAPNTVAIRIDIADPINAGLTQGDVLGLWLDVNDASFLPILNGLFSSPNFGNVFQNENPAGIVTAALAVENSVNAVGSSNNSLSGGGGAGLDFDIGIALGAQGSQAGFNQTISFDLVFDGIDTSVFFNERVGMRVQSITSPTFTVGSSRLLGGFPPPTSVSAPASLALLGVGLLALGLRKRLAA